MIFAKWVPILNELFIALSVMLILVFGLSKTAMFRRIVINKGTSLSEKFALAVFFGLSGILGTYMGVSVGDGFANTQAVNVIVAGLVGGKVAGLGAGVIAGLHQYYLDDFSDMGSAIATIVQGLLAGIVGNKLAPGKDKWACALVVGIVLEALHMILLLVINGPFDQGLLFIANTALPMLVINPLGIVALIAILESVFREQELIEGSAARLVLQIASNTITHLRKGLNRESAEKTAQIIFDMVPDLAGVAVTNRTEVLAFTGREAEHHFPEIITRNIQYSLETGESVLAQTHREIGFISPDSPIGSKIVAALKDKDDVIGTIVIFKLEERSITPFEVELINGLAQLISTQLEVSKSEHQSALLALAEIKALQAQINPHFLFNALNTIRYYCRKQPETARELLVHLGKYYRENIVAHDGLVDLATEMKHIRDYVVIETARFQDKLQVIYDVPDECNCLVPPLILQPIVENAIKHGLYPKRDGGTVTILGRLWEDKIVLTIEDNGVGMTPAQISEVLKPDPTRNNIGLSNVYSRLKSLYGEECGFLIESETAKGTRVTITLPVEGEIPDVKNNHS